MRLVLVAVARAAVVQGLVVAMAAASARGVTAAAVVAVAVVAAAVVAAAVVVGVALAAGADEGEVFGKELAMTEQRTCSSCDDTSCGAQKQRSGEADQRFSERQAIASRMCAIGKKIVVLSGKGGVGKSTVSANLAAALVMAGKTVGLVDIDIHGPSIPRMLHIDGMPVQGTETGILPIELPGGLKVMSMGLLLRSKDDAVIWRGPMKYTAIKQFLADVEWGPLDYLIVDCPPGTGDEPLAIIELIDKPDGAIVVTTPQQVAVQDVRRSIRFCEQTSVPVLGIIENMSGFICPHCGNRSDIFGAGGGEALAKVAGVPFLGAIPMDPQVVVSGDDGKPFVQSEPDGETAKAFAAAIRPLLEGDGATGDTNEKAV